MSDLWAGAGKTLAGGVVFYGFVVGYGSLAPEKLVSSWGWGLGGHLREAARSVTPQLLVASYQAAPRGPDMPNLIETPLPVFSVAFDAASPSPRDRTLEKFLAALSAVTQLPDASGTRTVSIACDRSRQWMIVRVQNPFDVARKDEIRIDFQMVGSLYPDAPDSITFLVRSMWSGRTDAPASQSVVDRVMQFLKPGLTAAARGAAQTAGGLIVA